MLSGYFLRPANCNVQGAYKVRDVLSERSCGGKDVCALHAGVQLGRDGGDGSGEEGIDELQANLQVHRRLLSTNAAATQICCLRESAA